MPKGSPIPEIEFLPETAQDANELVVGLRKEIVRIVQELKANPHLGELMGDKPPRELQGSRKIRFDLPSWHQKPRFRLVYRNEPTDGAVATVAVLAIGRRDRMIAYAKAAARIKARIAEEGLS
jgi:hypothetical protein